MRVGTNWTEETQALTREHLALCCHPGLPPVPMKAWDGRFGLLDRQGEVMRLVDRETAEVEHFTDVEVLIAAGWAVD